MIDTHALVDRLGTIESIAVIPRVSSTNLIARRIVAECIENELSLPQAMIIAGEQFAGRGRNDRTWTSPRDKGIYSTTLLTRPTHELALLPLEMANIVAGFINERFAIDARVKWPNDILVAGRKVAGILMEARIQEERAFLIIGIGVNVEPVSSDDRLNAAAISEFAPQARGGVEAATVAFVEHLDRHLSRPLTAANVLEAWRALTIHQAGDRITAVFGERTFTGTWQGIDDQGRALLAHDGGTTAVSAGELILRE